MGSGKGTLALRMALGGLSKPEGWAVASFVALSLASRSYILNRNAVPPGADPGNWLTLASLLTQGAPPWELPTPPLFLVLLGGLLAFLEPFAALRLAGTVLTSLAVVPFYLLSKRLAGAGPALVCTSMLALVDAYLDAVSWGAYPQLFAFFFMTAALYYFLLLVEQPSRRNVWLASLATMLTIGTHHLTAVLLVLILAPTLLVRILTPDTRRPMIQFLAFSTLLSSPFAPFYYNLLRNVSIPSRYYFFQARGANPLFDQLGYLFSQAVGIWFAIMAVALLAITLPRREPTWLNRRILLASYLLLPLLVFSLLETHFFFQLRLLYFVFIPMLLLFGVFISDVKRRVWRSAQHPMLKVALLGLLILPSPYLAANSISRLDRHANFYNIVTPEVLDGLNWLRSNTSPHDIVATSGADGYSGQTYGWWIQGYSKRKALMTAPEPRVFLLEEERKGMILANSMFYSGSPTKAYEEMKAAGVAYVFQSKWRAVLVQKFSADDELFQRVFENNSVVIFRVR